MKRNLGLVVFFVFVVSDLMFAQGLGSISGVVTDPFGAAVVNAKVTAKEVNTNAVRNVVTDTEGVYVIPSLRPAEYAVTVAAQGFRTLSQTGVQLLANQSLTLNLKLAVGTISETVQVESNPIAVDTSSSTLKQVIEEKRVTDLPLNGRNAAELTLLVAGAVRVPQAVNPTSSSAGGSLQGQTKTFPGALAIVTNGSRQNEISYMLDGGNNVDEYTNVNQPFPFPDALQEFSIQTSNYSAEYGQNAGGVVNIITKSGTRDFHGDLFEFVRNRVFNAKNLFSTTGADPLKRNQFGGTFGGPVIFPGHNGNKRTFFFTGYQGTRIRTATTANSTVPSQNDINAATSIDPASANLLKFLPRNSNPASEAVTYVRPVQDNLDEFVGKVDHSFSDRDRLMGRYYRDHYKHVPVFDAANILSYQDGADILSQNILLAENHLFRLNLLNDFRFSFAREIASRGPASNVPSVVTLGVTLPFQPAQNAIQQVRVNSGFAFGDNPHGVFARNNFTWGDDVSWVKGKHDLHFGATVERSRVDLNNLFFQPAEFSFNSISDFLAGKLGDYSGNPAFRQGAGEFKNNRNTFLGIYAQDNFRVTPRLTLNFGLRYEPALPWREIKGRQEVFSLAGLIAGVHSKQFPNAPAGVYFPGDTGVPENGTKASLNNFAPRVGFAWDVFGGGKTSVRGGAGMFYDTRIPGIVNNRFADVTPFSPQLILSTASGATAPGPFSNPLNGPSGPVANPFPSPFPPPANTAFAGNLLVISYAPSIKYQVPTLYNWNLTIEHQLPAGFLSRVAYVGSHSSHLKESLQMNPSLPGAVASTPRLNLLAGAGVFGQVFQDKQDVNASYNALQLSLEKRAGKGLTLLTNYTWSKSLDDLPVGGGVADIGSDSPSALPWDDPNRHAFDHGPSDFDHKQRFVASYVWQIPGAFKENGWARGFLGNWTLSGLISAQGGRPFTVLSGKDNSHTTIGQDRGYIIGPAFGPGACAFDKITSPCSDFLVPASFSTTGAPTGTFGNMTKNGLRWPGSFNWDMSVLKNFRLSERLGLQFRADYFNVFNTVNFSSDDASVNTTVRGVPTAGKGTFGAFRTADDPRIGQLALKLMF